MVEICLLNYALLWQLHNFFQNIAFLKCHYLVFYMCPILLDILALSHLSFFLFFEHNKVRKNNLLQKFTKFASAGSMVFCKIYREWGKKFMLWRTVVWFCLINKLEQNVTAKVPIMCLLSYTLFTGTCFAPLKLSMYLFFPSWVYFHDYSRITGLQGKGEDISLTPHYHFHTLHRHLDISRVITTENSPLHIASSRTRIGNLWFPSASF